MNPPIEPIFTINERNQQQFQELLTFIDFAEPGKFTLGFLEIDSARYRDSLIEELKQHPQCQDNQLEVFDFRAQNLRFLKDEIVKRLSIVTIAPEKKLVITLINLENSIGIEGEYPPLLQDLNFVRDAFLRSVPYPLLICLPEYAINRLAKFAPDFWAWKSGIFHFEDTLDTKLDFSISEFTQDPELNSLLRKERDYQESDKNQDNYIKILTSIGKRYTELENFEKAKEYLESALKNFEKSIENRKNLSKESLEVKVDTLLALGDICDLQRQFEKALKHYRESLEIYRVHIKEDNILLPIILRKIARTCTQKDELELSLDYYIKAEKIYVKKRLNKDIDRENLAQTLLDISEVYLLQKKLSRAIDYCESALAIYEQEPKNDKGIAATLSQKADIKIKQDQLEKAEELFGDAIHFYKKINDKQGQAKTERKLADIKAQQNKKDEAIALFRSASELDSQRPQIKGILAQINQVDEAISRYQKYQYRNRKTLLNKVRNYWVDGVLKTSLQGRVPIELGMEEALDLVEGASIMISELLNYQDRPTLSPGTKVINKLDQMGEGATLLVVGEPGGGKTTTLLELAHDLINRAERDTNQPIPVVLDISSWGKKKQNIEDWIVEEFTTKYQVSESLSKDWLKEQQILLLLDNLDELSPKSQKLCVQALNEFTKKYGQTQIVVCSCIRDYELLSNRLKFQGAIYLQPLTSEQVYRYLARSDYELTTVMTVLQEDTALQELVNTPLMLSIIIHAFQGMSVKELSEKYSITERRRYLFNTYIEQAFYHRSARQPYSKELVIKWLTWLAKRMSQKSQNIFLIEHLQPSWLQTSIQKWMYYVGVGLITGLIGGAISGLIGVLIGQRITVLIGVVITGLITGFIGVLIGISEPVETLKWSQRKALIELNKGLVIGFSLGLFIGFFGQIIGVFISVELGTLIFFGLLTGITCLLTNRLGGSEIQIEKKKFSNQGLVIGFSLGLFFTFFGQITGVFISVELGTFIFFGLLGIITGLLTNGFSEPQIKIEKRKFFNQGIWQSLVNAVIVALISILLSGFMSEIITGQPFGIVIGLIGGMISGASVSIARIQHFLLRLILWQSGSIPWNYSRFLNYSTKRMFLQKKSGGSYIFIYRLLQEHFTSL